ncbi:WD repeat domain phosphoinositide-interacting protein 2 [Eumeta japonica]|uniref:WD repeat domain phosphoinositide-interacting protein 2 n=1 Tax=Eumeta variegata TaxID=151549 RepID=A0A4C1Y021_EUMVA|nr:WD repeat domain phosphoinositide-interacting protein 2 [Eumeta japonica]
MSTGSSPATEGSSPGGLFVQFNQDCTSLVAGSSVGYHLYALTADDGIEEIYASRSGHDTCLVDRLFSSSLVAVVTLAAPRSVLSPGRPPFYLRRGPGPAPDPPPPPPPP